MDDPARDKKIIGGKAFAAGLPAVGGEGMAPCSPLACLLHNTVLAACRRHGVGVPDA